VQKSLDQMTPAELKSVGFNPLSKVLHVDLAKAGYNTVEKVEGLALIDAATIAVINDNDFGVAQIQIDSATGTYKLADGYVPEPEVLGVIRTPGLDASDRDNVINIRSWPLYGMYQPDALANFTIGNKRYLVTANEGDARDYDGFSEELRGGSTAARNLYGNLPEQQDNLQLGRLNLTNSPPNGDTSKPYTFGARSFSIWDARNGDLVWDSGAELEVRTAAALPKHFNSDNSENSFDTRSDNKGPEPEGVAVGVVDGKTYAFIGLERIGGVMVYDVSKPAAPQFVQYINNRSFEDSTVGPDSGPEVLRFIDARHSPTRRPLLVVANEVTGTVTLYSIDRDNRRERDDDRWEDDED
jgi:hypothetical protein